MKKGYVCIAFATIFFSTMEIALKITSLGFNPMQMNFIRFFIGAAVLLPFGIHGARAKGLRLTKGDVGFFALTGFLCVVVSMSLYQLAVMKISASIVAILFSCNPVFVIPFACLLLGERVTKLTAVQMALCLLGIVFIMNPFHISANPAGIALTLASAVVFALYGVVGKRRSARYGGVVLTSFSFLAGSMEMLLLIFLTHLGPVAQALTGAGFAQFADIPLLAGITPQSLPGLAYIGICVTGLGYCFYLLAMELTSAATASLVFFIKPALAPVLAMLILREALTPNMLIGIALIVGGSMIALCVPAYAARRKAARLCKDAEEDENVTDLMEEEEE